MKKVTMRQLAKMAGVSAMTVSKALSGKPGVSDDMRRRIMDIAEKLNYTPNTLATSFRTDRTNTIGVIISSTFETVFALLFQGIEEVAKKSGFGILVATTADDLDAEAEAIKMLVGKRVDGLILTSSLQYSEDQRQLLDSLGVPYVLTVRSCSDPAVTTVLNNNYMSAYGTVEYLLKTGSRRFLLLPMEKTRCSTWDRLRGWQDALRDNGIAAAPKYTEFVSPVIEGGYDAMQKCIRNGLECDAVVCGNDTIAIGAMEAMLENGIEIPRQVRLTGYDGLPLTGYLRVPLTTVQQPLCEIGRIGMRLLAEKIENPSAPAQQVVINSKLVIRCST